MNNNLVNNKNLSKLVQSGAIGLAILLIAVVVYQLKLNNDLISNHMNESTNAIKESTRTQEKLLGAINTWGKEINGLNDSIQKFMEYVAPPLPNYP